jgi:hypothetical protein
MRNDHFLVAFSLVVCLMINVCLAKDEYLVSGIKSATLNPFGLPSEMMENFPHDKCAVSIPVPGVDDSLTLVTLGIDRAIWIKRFNGEDWGEWISLNGTSSSGPSAIKDEKDQLHVFIRGLDGLIWHRFEKDGEWSEWMHLGNVKTTSGPVAIVNSEGLISVFAIGSNKAVWVNTQEGLKDNEGVCTSGRNFPTPEQEATVANAESIMTTNNGFDTDSPNHKPLQALVQTQQDTTSAQQQQELRNSLVSNATAEANREWSRVDALKTTSAPVKDMKYVWSGWENLGGVWTSKPTVTVNHEGLLSVFVRGVDRSIYYASQETSAEHGLVWSDWIWLKGNFASAPKISSVTTSEGMVVLTARGMDKSFYIKKQVADADGVEWGKWEPVGGLWSSGPTVLSPYSDTIELFGLGIDLSVWHKVYTANADGEYFWSAPECLQGRFSSSVSVVKDTSGLLHVFTRGFDQALWVKQQFPDANNVAQWGNWTSIGGSTLHYAC